MKWNVDFSPDSLKFLARNHISELEIIEKVRLALLKFDGKDVSIDIRKTKGKWAGFHRIRTGKLRILAAFYFSAKEVFVDTIDWRGNVYK
jgi:mRNA interferase RelE/StbE